MPTYDYECTACKHTFEAFQSMADDPLEECPKCGKKVRRLIGGGMGIIFKGSGFYSTDSRNGGNGTKPKSEPAEPAAEKPAAKESSSKPDTKKDTVKSKN
jgi:putative FmdB family regulatory protein